MRFTRPLMISAIATAGVLALAGCVDSGAPHPRRPPRSTRRSSSRPARPWPGSTKPARSRSAPSSTSPCSARSTPSGDPQGFDVEIAKIIAAELGIPESGITWTETVSANREPFIQSGEVDIVVATYTINDERKEVISFAGPYYDAGQDILVLAGNPEGIEGPDDLAGKTVCTVAGSTSEANIEEYTDQVTSSRRLLRVPAAAELRPGRSR